MGMNPMLIVMRANGYVYLSVLNDGDTDGNDISLISTLLLFCIQACELSNDFFDSPDYNKI